MEAKTQDGITSITLKKGESLPGPNGDSYQPCFGGCGRLLLISKSLIKLMDPDRVSKLKCLGCDPTSITANYRFGNNILGVTLETAILGLIDHWKGFIPDNIEPFLNSIDEVAEALKHYKMHAREASSGFKVVKLPAAS